MKKIVLIVGARPNYMKAFPVYNVLEPYYDLTLIHTGQHFDQKMNTLFFDQLKFPKPDIQLDIINKKNILDEQIYNNSDILTERDEMINILKQKSGPCQFEEIRDKLLIEFDKINPDLVIVFGDVTSTLASAIASKIKNIKLAHVESGLRSFDLSMPEEVNRILTDYISDYLFVSEYSGIANLKKENITDNVYLVGNTMIDTQKKYYTQFMATNYHKKLHLEKRSYVLVTLHRPSNVDHKLDEILDQLVRLSEKYKIVYLIHPRTRDKLVNYSGNIMLIEPLGYLEFSCLMANSLFVITDSGGVQEETTALNVMCYTLRDNTERPCTLVDNYGTNRLINKIDEINDYLGENVKGRMDLWDGSNAKNIRLKINNIF